MTQIPERLAGATRQVSDHAALSNTVARFPSLPEATSLPSKKCLPYTAIVIFLVVSGLCLHSMYDVSQTCTDNCANSLDLSLFLLVCVLILTAIVLRLGLRASEERARIFNRAEVVGLDAIEGMPLASQGDTLSVVASLTQTIKRERLDHANKHAELLAWQAAYAHDLRTPLTRMGLRCELLDDAKLRRSMERDLSEMCQLVEESMACAKLQRSEPPQLGHVNIDELLATLIENYRDMGVTLGLDGRADRLAVACPHALRRVMSNLIDNALLYGEEVVVQVRTLADRVELAVLDSGPGIEASKLEAVLSPWYRASETAQRAPGSGLGLSIALRLTQAMQGQLRLRNRDSGGLEACVTLSLMTASGG